MPIITPTLWLLAGLFLIMLVVLAFVAARRWQQAHISASQYRTASGRTIDADTRRIQHQPMATRRVRAGPVSAVSQSATDQALRLANNHHIRERATFAGRHDANSCAGRRPNPFGSGSRSAILWFGWYEPAYLDALAKLPPPAATATPPEDLQFFEADRCDSADALHYAMHAYTGTVQTTARQPVKA